ncbi:MAG: prolyl oligopeptidase family serine peptidase [Polyangiaceae bacterium]|nr:prolyl oligopeptidase family serine peptidase [Polyangiaceae bacterium]
MERFRSVYIAALLAAFLSVCCSHPAPQGAAGSPSATTSEQPTQAAPSASATAPSAQSRCLDDDHGETQNADGTTQQVTCTQGTLCLGGACAPLQVPEALGGGSVPREQVLEIGGRGWLNAWSSFGPFDRAQVNGFVKNPQALLDESKNGGSKAFCAPSGRLDVKPRGGGHQLLGLWIVSARAEKAWVLAGNAGKMRVWLAGSKAANLIDVARTQGFEALADEQVAPIELAAGPNMLLVDLEGSDEGPPSAWVRLRGETLESSQRWGIAPLTPKSVCTLSALVDIGISRAVTQDGLDVEFGVSLLGLTTRSARTLTYEVTLAGKKSQELAQGQLTSADLLSVGGAKIKTRVAPSSGGKQSVRIAIGDGPKVERSFAIAYRKKLFPRVAELLKALESLPQSVPLGSRDSFTRDVQEIARAVADGHPDESWITKRLETAEELAASFARGQDAYRDRIGVVHRAYRSELDGQLQPYVAFIPKQHKPDGAPLPMIVSFHGLTHAGEHALRAVIGEATKEDENPDFSARHLPSFPSQGAILVAPWGYGKSGAKHLGEHDVLRVIEEMKAAYRVDTARVSITGYSLGGTVAFALSLHYPSVFSAAAPLCGYPNLTTYNSIKDVPHTPWEDAMIARRFWGNYAANGMHVPMHIVHGGQDGPGRSKVIADRYTSLGYSRIFDVQDDLGHNVWDYAYKDGRMVAWLKKKQKPSPPARVRLVTGEYRYNTAHWVRLIAMTRSPGAPGTVIEKTDQPDSFADIDAQMDWSSKTLRIATRNVEMFAIDSEMLGTTKQLNVTVDGTNLSAPEGAKVLYFSRGEKGFSVSTEEPSRVGKKRQNVSGPIDDVFRHPQLIVYGTLDPLQTETNRTVAEYFSSAEHWSAARFPIKADRDVSDADLTGRSLVLIGGPKTNRVTAMFAENIPVKFEANALIFREKRYEGDSVGTSFIYPHPRDTNEYVVVHAGSGFKGTLYSRHLPQFAPDFLIYDQRITAQRGELLLDKRAVLEGGFFDDGWK